jgi:hypothetical protein
LPISVCGSRLDNEICHPGLEARLKENAGRVVTWRGGCNTDIFKEFVRETLTCPFCERKADNKRNNPPTSSESDILRCKDLVVAGPQFRRSWGADRNFIPTQYQVGVTGAGDLHPLGGSEKGKFCKPFLPGSHLSRRAQKKRGWVEDDRDVGG